MRYRLFQYPLPTEADLADLNAYLGARRVAAVTQHVVQTAGGAMLVFIVETAGPGGVTPGGATPKVDYRNVLSEEDFATFSRLRDARKAWAEAEGVPVYTVFTNAQLAEIVKRRPGSLPDLAAIEGVGKARVEKFGARILPLVAPPAAESPAPESAP